MFPIFHLRYPPLGSHRMPPLRLRVCGIPPLAGFVSVFKILFAIRLDNFGQKQQKRPPLKSMWPSFCSGHSLSYCAYRIGGLSFPPVIDTPLSREGSKTRDKLYERRYVAIGRIKLSRKRRNQPWFGC
jgi:hypothetical protein